DLISISIYMDNFLFNLIILSRDGVIYKDSVTSISSYNASGKFDVLAQHANFISLINTEVIVRDTKGKDLKFPLSNALIKVKQNNVKIYLGIDWFMRQNQKTNTP